MASFFINEFFFFKAISISNVGLEPTNPEIKSFMLYRRSPQLRHIFKVFRPWDLSGMCTEEIISDTHINVIYV